MIYMMNYLNFILVFMEMLIMVLVSVAFLTLLERKVLSYIQIRKGPNKMGFIGLLQPFSDAIKLFSKESMIILKSNYLFFLFSPIFSLLLLMMMWSNLTFMSKVSASSYMLLMIFILMSVGVYGIMLAGWSSNSMYSLMGSLRSVAQTISYEVGMILIMLSVVYLCESLNMYVFIQMQYYSWFIWMMFPLGLIFFVSLLAELNRTPFDLAEGESELVSGFNIEYMSGSFAMIFIAEYGMIMFMMYLFISLFMMGNIYNISFYLLYMFMVYLVIWIRGTFPRFRYDKLMNVMWKVYLPVSLMMLSILICISILIK